MNKSIKQISEALIKILLLLYLFLLPLHYFLFNIILSDFSFLKIWKEVTVSFIVLFFILTNWNGLIKLKRKSANIYSLLSIVFIVISCLYFLVSDNKIPALNILRIYLIPVVLYIVIKKIEFTDNEIALGIKVLFVEAILISVYSIIQSILLGPEFLIDLGYPVRENGRLSTSFYLSGFGDFQRASGTFVSSNTFAFYISIVFIVSLFFMLNKSLLFLKNKILIIATLLISLLGLFFSFSRSSWLGTLIAASLMLFDVFRKDKLSFSWKLIRKFTICMTIVCVLLITILSVITQFNYFSLIIEYAINTISFKDTSAVSHVSSYLESFEIFISNIFGTGLGLNGPKAAIYFDNFYQTESSYFLILFEFGIIGFFIYYMIYVCVPIKYYFNKMNLGVTNYLFIFALVSYLFLPYVQDMEIVSYLFIALGISISKIQYQANKDINILFLHSSAEFYGSDKSLYNLVVNLSKESNEINKIHVILPCNGVLKSKLEDEKNDSIVVHSHKIGVLRRKDFNFTGILKYIIEYFISVIYISYYIDRNNINVVYTNTSVVLPGGLAAKIMSVNNIWHIRETLDKNSFINRIIIRYILFLSDNIIANSQSTLDNFLLKPIKKSHVVYNAVNPIEKTLPKYNYNDIDFVIGMAGRINSWKGQELFIEAASLTKRAVDNRYNIIYLIAGDAYIGDEYLIEELKKQISQLDMENEIILLGQVNDMAGFYNSIDLFVLPSTKPEPFGLVVIEAMSLGIPVIASNKGGPLEIIENCIDGILFENQSAEDLSKKMISLIEDKKLYSRISENAKKKQQDKFSIENYYQSIYRIIIGG